MVGVLLLFAAAQVQVAKSYVQTGFDAFDSNQKFRSVGVFGSFGKGSTVEERGNVGLLTFTLNKDAPENTVAWANFDDGKDLVLGRAVFPGQVTEKTFQFDDWATSHLKFSSTEDGRPVTNIVTFSRAFPAVLYTTTARTWAWRSGPMGADFAAYRDTNGRVVTVRKGERIGPMGSPWIVLWSARAGQDVVPMLIRLAHKPRSLVLQDEGLKASFDSSSLAVVVMPLYGVRRSRGSGTTAWAQGLPSSAAKQADLWSRISGACPFGDQTSSSVGPEEAFTVNDSKQKVRITNRYRYAELHDDWNTKPLRIAPVPPIVALAQANGYPVKWLGKKPVTSEVATLLGPYAYIEGDIASYEIPIPAARDNELAPVDVVSDPAREAAKRELNLMAAGRKPKTDDTGDGGLNLQLKEYSQGFPLFDASTRTELAKDMETALDAAFAPENLQTVTDPVTGRNYVMCSKIWCAGEPYDREWYAGRQLDAAAQYGAWVDPKAIGKHWKAIQGMYAYYRIYNDWAWSGTLSSVFAYALCGDGMNFAMEGMLGVARMAKWHGDEELYRDATYRASKEALNTYASWYVSDWLKGLDYVTWTDTSYDYAAKKGRYEIHRMKPEDVETRFGLDIFSDYTGIKAFRPGSFWHASAAVYWNNPSLDRLYAETLYPKLYRWEYDILPKLHPNWTDRAAIETFSNQPYGSNLVLAHLDARSVLFGQAPSELAALTTKLQPDIAFHYRLRAQEDLVQSGVPQLWLPTGDTRVVSARWDAEKKELSATLRGLHEGRANVDWCWRTGPAPVASPGPKPASVTVNGRMVRYSQIRGGYFRAPIAVGRDREVAVRIVYR